MNKINANVAARWAAITIFEIICEETANHSGRALTHYWSCLLAALRDSVPEEAWPRTEVVRDEPMTDSEVHRFETETIPFGKHQGEQIKDVPLDYLLWLEEQPDFRRQLNRYLRSDRLQREQESS